MPYEMGQPIVGPSGVQGVEAYLHNQQANNQLGLGYANLAQKYAQDQATNQLAQQNRADAMTRFLGSQATAKQQLEQSGQYQQGELANRSRALDLQGQYQTGELANRQAQEENQKTQIAQQGQYQTGELAAKNADLQMRVHDVIERQSQDESDRINKTYDSMAKNPMYADDPVAQAKLEQDRDAKLDVINQKRLLRHNMAAKGNPWGDPNSQPQQAQGQSQQPPPQQPQGAGQGVPITNDGGGNATQQNDQLVNELSQPQAPAGEPNWQPDQNGNLVDPATGKKMSDFGGGKAPELSLTRPQDPLQAAQSRYQARQKKQGVIGTYQKQLDATVKSAEGITLPDGTNGADVLEDAQQKLNQILADPRSTAQDAAQIFQDPKYQAVRAAIHGKVQNGEANTFQEKLQNVTSLAAREKMIDDYSSANGLGQGLPDASGRTQPHSNEMKNALPENQKADQIVADAYKDPVTGNFRTPDQAAAYIQYQKAKAARDFTKVDPNNPFFQAEIKQIMDSSVRQMASDTTRTGTSDSDTNSINDTLGLSAGDFGAMLSNSISVGNSKTHTTSKGESVGARKVIGMALQQWKQAQPDLKAEAGIKDMTGLQNKLDSAYSDAQDEAKKVGALGFTGGGADDQQQGGTPPPQNPQGPTPLGGATAAALKGGPGSPQVAQRFEQISGMLGGRAAYSMNPTPNASAGMSGAGPGGMQQIMQDLVSAPEQGSVGEGAKPALRAEQLQLWQAMSPEQQAFYTKQGFNPTASDLSNLDQSVKSKSNLQTAKNALIDTGKTAPIALNAMVPGMGGVVSSALTTAMGDIAEGKKSLPDIATDAGANIILGKALGVLAPKLIGAGKAAAEELGAKYPAAKTALQKMVGMGMPAEKAAVNVAKAAQVLGKDASPEAVEILAQHADRINPEPLNFEGSAPDLSGVHDPSIAGQANAAGPAPVQASPMMPPPQNVPAQGAPGWDRYQRAALEGQLANTPTQVGPQVNPSGASMAPGWNQEMPQESFPQAEGANIGTGSKQAAAWKMPLDATDVIETPSVGLPKNAAGRYTLTDYMQTPDEAARLGKQGDFDVLRGKATGSAEGFADKLQAQIDNGNNVVLHADNGRKVVQIKKFINGQAVDGQGQRWGALGGEFEIRAPLKPAEVPVQAVAQTATPQATAARAPAGPLTKAQYIEQATGPAQDLYAKAPDKLKAIQKTVDAQFEAQHNSQVASKVSQATGAKVTPEDVASAKKLAATMDLGGKGGDVLPASDLPKEAQSAIMNAIDDPRLEMPGPTVSSVQRVNQGIVPPGPGDAQLNAPSSTLPSEVQRQLLALANRKRAALIASGRGIGAPMGQLAATAAGR